MGNVYSDGISSTIAEWKAANNTVTTAVSSGLSFPQGVAVDGAGNVYIADDNHNAIKEWSPANNNLTALISSGLYAPSVVALDAAGNVYANSVLPSAIVKWTAANSNVTTLAISGISNPCGVAVDVAGNVYIADVFIGENGTGAIRKWTAANTNTTTLLSYGYSDYLGVAVDGSGNIYVAHTDSHTIEKWTAADGNLTTLVSSNLGVAPYTGPEGVAVDGTGNVYIADTYNHAIKELPYAFVDPTARLETAAAGEDALPVVLPSTENLLAPFAPTSDQPWLTISGTTNGVVNFSFTANTTTSNRTASITLLGQTICVTQAPPPTLIGATMLGNGLFQFAFTNINLSTNFTVLATTNIFLPLTNWTVIGTATNIAPGLFQFTDPQATNAQCFYTILLP
jgi:sugar lactone lactonase YvrE